MAIACGARAAVSEGNFFWVGDGWRRGAWAPRAATSRLPIRKEAPDGALWTLWFGRMASDASLRANELFRDGPLARGVASPAKAQR